MQNGFPDGLAINKNSFSHSLLNSHLISPAFLLLIVHSDGYLKYINVKLNFYPYDYPLRSLLELTFTPTTLIVFCCTFSVVERCRDMRSCQTSSYVSYCKGRRRTTLVKFSVYCVCYTAGRYRNLIHSVVQ